MNALLGQSLRDYSLLMSEKFDWDFGDGHQISLDSNFTMSVNVPLPPRDEHPTCGNNYLPCNMSMTMQTFKKNLKL